MLGSQPQVYQSSTVNYLFKVQATVDNFTWKLLIVILERYYSIATNVLVQARSSFADTMNPTIILVTCTA